MLPKDLLYFCLSLPSIVKQIVSFGCVFAFRLQCLFVVIFYILRLMINIYNYLKLFKNIRSKRVKLAGILAMHLLRRRYIGIFIDPVLACNFRCRMCYFSDETKRRSMRGSLDERDIDSIAEAFFKRALKLQIGCGAEPTLSKYLTYLIKKGRDFGVPYISITTNGGVLDEALLRECLEAGLNEVTLSCHGVKRESYEYFMPGGSYDHFLTLLQTLAKVKLSYPSLNVRLNYTMNEDNVEELSLLSDLLKDIPVNVVQLRPIQSLGESVYANFNIDKIRLLYDDVLEPLRTFFQERNIVGIMPTKENLNVLHQDNDALEQFIEDLLYCHISPNSWWQDDFVRYSDTFDTYCKRHHWARKILSCIMCFKKRSSHDDVTKKMNYSIK